MAQIERGRQSVCPWHFLPFPSSFPLRPSSPLRLSSAGAWRRHVGEGIGIWGVLVPGRRVNWHNVNHVSLEDGVSVPNLVFSIEEGDASDQEALAAVNDGKINSEME